MRFANFLNHIYLASKIIDIDASVSQNTRLKYKVHNGFHDQILSHVHTFFEHE